MRTPNPNTVVMCTPRYLPADQRVEAIKRARAIRDDNLPPGMKLEAPPGSGRLALDVTKYWGKSGVKLTVGFLDGSQADLRARILAHMNAWSRTANVSFVETSTDPQVRIARGGGGNGGYWSYVGTDVLGIRTNGPTMNLEGFTMATPDSEFHRVVRHETGHTLGFPHEHMRKELVDRLDRDRVIAEFMQTQGWSKQEVIDQVLTPLEESSILGTAPNVYSIMCYQIAAHLTKDGKAIPGGLDIDPSDYAFAARVYPKGGA